MTPSHRTVVVCCCLVLATCKRDVTPPGIPPNPPPEPSAPIDVPSFQATGALAAPYDDAYWHRAAGGDPLDLSVLAAQRGATELLQIAQAGGRVGRTALLALAYASDADLAWPQLCTWLGAAADPDSVDALTRAMHQMLLLGAPSEEAEHVSRVHLCVDALNVAKNRPSASTQLRDRIATIEAMGSFRLGR